MGVVSICGVLRLSFKSIDLQTMTHSQVEMIADGFDFTDGTEWVHDEEVGRGAMSWSFLLSESFGIHRLRCRSRVMMEIIFALYHLTLAPLQTSAVTMSKNLSIPLRSEEDFFENGEPYERRLLSIYVITRKRKCYFEVCRGGEKHFLYCCGQPSIATKAHVLRGRRET